MESKQHITVIVFTQGEISESETTKIISLQETIVTKSIFPRIQSLEIVENQYSYPYVQRKLDAEGMNPVTAVVECEDNGSPRQQASDHAFSVSVLDENDVRVLYCTVLYTPLCIIPLAVERFAYSNAELPADGSLELDLTREVSKTDLCVIV